MSNHTSIIMSSYNSASFIAESIQSIQKQTYTSWELLITDDASTDDTVEIIQSLVYYDSRIKFFQLKHNKGAAVARNHSIKHAKGRFIAFCDSDDQWKPEKLEKQISFMIENKIAFSYTSYDCIDESGNPLQRINCKPKLIYTDLLKNNYIGCLTVIYDTKKLGKQYMPLLRKRQDWALWLKLLKNYDRAMGLQDPLAIYRERIGSVSSNKIEMLKYNWLIYYRVEGFGLIRSVYQMCLFLFYYFKKKLW